MGVCMGVCMGVFMGVQGTFLSRILELYCMGEYSASSILHIMYACYVLQTETKVVVRHLSSVIDLVCVVTPPRENSTIVVTSPREHIPSRLTLAHTLASLQAIIQPNHRPLPGNYPACPDSSSLPDGFTCSAVLDGPWPFVLQQRQRRMLGPAVSSRALSQCAWGVEDHADNVTRSDVVSCYKINYKVVRMPSWNLSLLRVFVCLIMASG